VAYFFGPPCSFCGFHRGFSCRQISLQADSICVLQEAVELFRDARKLARSEASPRKTELLAVLLDSNLVELVQTMWRRHLRPELLDQDEDLPDHILASLGVSTDTARGEKAPVCLNVARRRQKFKIEHTEEVSEK